MKRQNPSSEELSALLDEMLEPALPEAEVGLVEQALEADAETFDKVAERAFRVAFIEGLRNMPKPKSVKEVATMYDLFRKSSGRDKEKAKDAGNQGFVPTMRVVNRRMIEVVEVERDPLEGFEV